MKHLLKPVLACSFIACCCAYSMGLSRFSLKQALNIPAIKMIGNIIRQPSLALPCVQLDRLSDLNLRSLKENGIKCIVFDKDNTLCYSFTDELHPVVKASVSEAQKLFSRSGVAILSNSVGTTDDVNYEGAKITESKLGIPVIRHLHKKPGCIDEVSRLKKKACLG